MIALFSFSSGYSPFLWISCLGLATCQLLASTAAESRFPLGFWLGLPPLSPPGLSLNRIDCCLEGRTVRELAPIIAPRSAVARGSVAGRLAASRLAAVDMVLQYSALQLLQLLSFFSSAAPVCLDAIRSSGLLQRPRYIHRSSRYKFIHTNSSIPVVQSALHFRVACRRHLNTRHVRTSCLKPLACSDSSTPPVSSAATFMLLNTRSLNNKALLIHDIIIDKKLDFLCLTETWQNQQDFFALNQATPPGYVYLHKPRSTGRGGGLAVIHRAGIRVREIPSPNIT